MSKEIHDNSGQIETQYLINTNKFILLSVLTFGLYQIWWIYKSWRFFGQKENADLAPAIRAILGIFCMIPLFTRIKRYAISREYPKNYHSGLLFLGYLLTVFLTYLPFPSSWLTVFSIFFLIPPFNALNFAKRNSENVISIEQEKFNVRQIILIIIGSLLWLLSFYYLYLLRN